MKKLLVFLILPVPMVFALLLSNADKNVVNNQKDSLTHIENIKNSSKFLDSFSIFKKGDKIISWDGIHNPTKKEILRKIDSYGNDSLRMIYVIVKRGNDLYRYKIPNS